MANKKRHPELKARVALDAIAGKSKKHIAEVFDVHQAQVTQWTQQLIKNAYKVFEPESSLAEESCESDQ